MRSTQPQGGNQTAAHTALLRRILLDLGGEPGLLLWEHKTGRYRAPYSERWIDVGLPGSPDIIGFIAGSAGPARFIGLEVKTGDATLSPQQRAFHAAAIQRGALIFTVHSVEEARLAITKARAA